MARLALILVEYLIEVSQIRRNEPVTVVGVGELQGSYIVLGA
jgi:hypothetical protein